MKAYYLFSYFIVALAIVFKFNVDSPNRNPATADASFGVFPDYTKLIEDHNILSTTSVEDLTKFIEYTSYDNHLCNDHYHDDYSSLDDKNSPVVLTKKQLAEQIHDLSKCFNIDAGIFAALVYKESQFCNFGGKVSHNYKPIKTNWSRKSSTGAIGLTQFTTIAIKEVHDQLFREDRRYFHFKARPEFHKMMAKCGFALDFDYDIKNYYKHKIWSKDIVYMKNKLYASQLKKPENWQEQLLYGAVKLKLLLTLKAQPNRFIKDSNSINHYYKAVKKYNSAGGSQERLYWQYIFSAYNDYFNPQFKEMAQKEQIYFSTRDWDNAKDNFRHQQI